MQNVLKILNEDEEIIWAGRERFWPRYSFAVIRVVFLFIFVLIFLSIPFVFLNRSNNNSAVALLLLLFIPFLLYIIYIVLLNKSVSYLITDKRVLSQSGIISRNFKIVDFDKITNIQVDINFLDRMAGKETGSLMISISNLNDKIVFKHIPTVYNVAQILKKSSFNAKADIQFPNDYRPDENHGYKTQLKQ